jgi:hypothetical protein
MKEKLNLGKYLSKFYYSSNKLKNISFCLEVEIFLA